MITVQDNAQAPKMVVAFVISVRVEKSYFFKKAESREWACLKLVKT